MEFRDLRLRVNKNIARIKKNDRLHVTFADKDDAIVFELEGSVSDFLNQCDGSRTVSEIIDLLKLEIVTEEEMKSFTEMLTFLQQQQIVEQA